MGRKEVVHFTEAATTLSAPLGHWVTIGGTSKDSNEVINEILSTATGKKDTLLIISSLVESD